MLKENINHYITLFIIFFVAHFIPFERSSLAPDYYSLFNSIQNLNYFILFPDRPILYFFLDFIYSFSDDINYFFYLLIIFNFINIIVVYLFYCVFFEKNTSFILTIIYLLLYLKLEIFHNSIMIHVSIVSSLYILCLFFLISYFIKQRKIFYIISIFLYIISVFWYEIGFFIPYVFTISNFENFETVIIELAFLAYFEKKNL